MPECEKSQKIKKQQQQKMIIFFQKVSFLTKVILLAFCMPYAGAVYILTNLYNTTSDFFSAFNFITSPDPTHGFVEYINETCAQNVLYIIL